jgi:hypothetical protein
LVFNTADQPITRKRSHPSPVEDEEHAAKRRASKVTLFAYCDPNSPRLSSVLCRHTAAYPENVTLEILERWLPNTMLLPPVNELSRFLDTPLHERAKIPVDRYQFDSLTSNSLDNMIQKADLHKLFRVDDQERAEALYRRASSALDNSPPPHDGTEHVFISFWDSNIRGVIEALISGGVSIRDGSCHLCTASQKPSFGFLYHNVCAFRGEEKAPNNPDDPRAELSNKMAWTYDPAPYVLGEVCCATSSLR